MDCEVSIGANSSGATNKTSAGDHPWISCIVMVPLFALCLAAFQVGLRRYFVEHLVFSFHLFSFYLVVATVLTVLNTAEALSRHLLHGPAWMGPVWLTDAIWWTATLVYMVLSLAKVYPQSRLRTGLKALGLTVCLLAVYLSYYAILTFATLLTT